MTWRAWAWIGGVTWVASFAALIGYLVAVGLDRADKVASVLALCLGILGLALQVVSLIITRRTPSGPVPTLTVVGGSKVLVRRVRGSSLVRLRLPGRLPTGFAPQAPPSPAGAGGQPGSQTYIRGNAVEIEDVGHSVVEEQ